MTASKLLQEFLTAYGIQPESLAPRLREDLERVQRHIAEMEVLLTPSGQVAEDERLLVAVCQGNADERQRLRSALSRLAAKAQGYEAAVEQRDAAMRVADMTQQTVELLNRQLEQTEKESDAAVADNAALVKLADALVDAVTKAYEAQPGRDLARQAQAAWMAAARLDDDLKQPHPGAALLEKHRKDVEKMKRENRQLRYLGEEQGKRTALLEQVLAFASSTDKDGWHLKACRAERRGMPGPCVELCAQLRATGRSGS